MDAYEVQRLILNTGLKWEDWEYDENEATVDGLGTVTLVDSKPGHEGGGEVIWMVFRVDFTNHWPETKYYQVDGYYMSYEGSTWDGDLYEVKPVQKMITEYVQVK